ncbi:hypothetical protein K431DRAFT_81868 [Polychaeton citri CBS 116435]|uniref:Uncharacterized protein n=1 Tax=Polychaeton citri CBS 116435 TaxID=1314669 RepID=A0A9P4QIR4_9PEZI|nr:hypothetical protein K431DRAFT_81868 [Polychaeton citri CBS 116435]
MPIPQQGPLPRKYAQHVQDLSGSGCSLGRCSSDACSMQSATLRGWPRGTTVARRGRRAHRKPKLSCGTAVCTGGQRSGPNSSLQTRPSTQVRLLRKRDSLAWEKIALLTHAAYCSVIVDRLTGLQAALRTLYLHSQIDGRISLRLKLASSHARVLHEAPILHISQEAQWHVDA